MTDYFRYDVHFVMNITDIDDKVRTGYGANIIKHLSPVLSGISLRVTSSARSRGVTARPSWTATFVQAGVLLFFRWGLACGVASQAASLPLRKSGRCWRS